MPKIGGRPRVIDEADIARVGVEIGLRHLSLNAVAARLGVSSTALYRHVDGRWGLERLVGESLLSELRLTDDPAHGVVEHLLSAALQLRSFLLQHRGLARCTCRRCSRAVTAVAACSRRRPRRSVAGATRRMRRSR